MEEYNNKDIWYIENKYQSSRHKSYFMSNCAECEGIKHSNWKENSGWIDFLKSNYMLCETHLKNRLKVKE